MDAVLTTYNQINNYLSRNNLLQIAIIILVVVIAFLFVPLGNKGGSDDDEQGGGGWTLFPWFSGNNNNDSNGRPSRNAQYSNIFDGDGTRQKNGAQAGFWSGDFWPGNWLWGSNKNTKNNNRNNQTNNMEDNNDYEYGEYSRPSGAWVSNLFSFILLALWFLLRSAIAIFFLLLLVGGILHFLYGIDVVKYFKHLFGFKNESDDDKNAGPPVDSGGILKKTPVPEIRYKKQVFNIPGNTYTYDDAKTLCSAYGSRLATYQEVEDVYNEGGEWCNYGWSDNQMALFPTQTTTYNDLQKVSGHENDCGRPGVNGGYIANPNVKFGINCYGFKPKINSDEEHLMQVSTPYPKTEKDIAFENRVEYWRTKLNQILVSPFNYDTWSRL
jgi:hypothetical protein